MTEDAPKGVVGKKVLPDFEIIDMTKSLSEKAYKGKVFSTDESIEVGNHGGSEPLYVGENGEVFSRRVNGDGNVDYIQYGKYYEDRDVYVHGYNQFEEEVTEGDLLGKDAVVAKNFRKYIK